jgi:hypothetical protein
MRSLFVIADNMNTTDERGIKPLSRACIILSDLDTGA